ncbi:MAG: hypothetical protein ACI8PP_002582 [Candidatus Pseudothioglobus sp.]
MISHEVTASLTKQLVRLPEIICGEHTKVIAEGRNRSLCIELEIDGVQTQVLVKCFGRQSIRNDLRDASRGSKAARSFHAAHHLRQHRVGTPAPLAFVEHWTGRRLEESYYLSLFLDSSIGFGDRMLHLYHKDRECEAFIESLRIVALGARKMHDSGFVHNDLGNQNILFASTSQTETFSTIDLNRGRIVANLSVSERARDLSRLTIPSGMVEMFLSMYWDEPAPKQLKQWFAWHKRLFDLHASSRRWRHPIREARIAREQENQPADTRYPDPRDVWVWDSKTNQAFGSMDRKHRLKNYPASRYLPMLRETLAAGPAIYKEYRRITAGIFKQPLSMSDSVGLSIEPHPTTFPRKLELLSELGPIPMLIRLHHHMPAEDLVYRKKAITTLLERGHPVAVSLLQSRDAVLDPDSWASFVDLAMTDIAERLDFVEVGHAINRVKWGIWSFDELETLYQPIRKLAKLYPKLRFTGPAGIDFEYPFIIAALKRWPQQIPLHALTHHLYVDRRGAPENPQNSFATVEKFALARAIAHVSGKTNGVIVTGVNWPLADAGPWSPIAQPIAELSSDVGGVSESVYSDYMLRYLCLARTSGLVDRVYWWQLVSRGYGLIDDTDADKWRPRQAWFALKHFNALMSDSRLLTSEVPDNAENQGLYCMKFERDGGELFTIAWSHGESASLAGIKYNLATDSCGQQITQPEMASGSPIYLHHLKD